MKYPSLPTVDEIMLIQPNNMTFGKYKISAMQENILTLISDRLQAFVTRNIDIPKDIFRQPYVEIHCDDAGGMNNKAKVKQEALDLCNKTFAFKWNHPYHKAVETEGVLITTVHNIKRSNSIIVNFNIWAIPFLIYYGTGVGGTRFNKGVALSFSSVYTKRLYKIICSKRDLKEFYYNIVSFREDLAIPASYDNAKIEERILKASMESINDSSSDVNFTYKMICRNKAKGKKPKHDTIVLFMQSKETKASKKARMTMYNEVYRWMCNIYKNKYESDKALEITDKLEGLEVIERVHGRIKYYDDMITSGKNGMTTAKAYNSLAVMLYEEYSIAKPVKPVNSAITNLKSIFDNK